MTLSNNLIKVVFIKVLIYTDEEGNFLKHTDAV